MLVDDGETSSGEVASFLMITPSSELLDLSLFRRAGTSLKVQKMHTAT